MTRSDEHRIAVLDPAEYTAVAFEQVADDYIDPHNSGSYATHVSWHIRQQHTKIRVAFTAAITVSNDDEAFGFFKRPTKAERI